MSLKGKNVIEADLAKGHTGKKQNGRNPCKFYSSHVNLQFENLQSVKGSKEKLCESPAGHGPSQERRERVPTFESGLHSS